MLKAISLCILVLLTSSQVVTLLHSEESTTNVVSPGGATTTNDIYHNTNNPNWVGALTGAKWIWSNLHNSGQQVPSGATHTFEANFYTDCPQKKATLRITADNTFSAFVNGNLVSSGNTWTKVYTTDIKLQCGKNSFSVRVVNQDHNTPAAVIFAIIQDQKGCHDCKNSAATYWNKQTCSCDCICDKCTNSNPLHVWLAYPTCSCGCRQSLKCSKPQFFNKKTCRCECPPISCADGYVLDKNKCQCVKKLCTVDESQVQCGSSTSWSQKECRCVEIKPACLIFCFSPFVLDIEQCKCVEKSVCLPQNCGINPRYQWDPNQCKCVDCHTWIKCGLGYTPNPAGCGCIKLRPTCRLGCRPPSVLSNYECKCVDPSLARLSAEDIKNSCSVLQCKMPWVKDQQKCQCIIPPIKDAAVSGPKDIRAPCTKQCTMPFILDYQKCDCVVPAIP